MAEESDAALTDRVKQWQQFADDHQQNQLINPFSNWEGACHRQKLSKDDENYGKPVSGSKTEFRGKQADEHISREVTELCYVISDLGKHEDEGTVVITFGELFEAYLTISNKLVGTLIRARKNKFVYFQGEMLYQGRDENVPITLLHLPERT